MVITRKKSSTDENVSLVNSHSSPVNRISMRERNSKKYHDILIVSDDYTDPEYYNDYSVDFITPYKNVIGLKLDSYSFPRDNNNIRSERNKFYYSIGGKERRIELENGEYNIDRLVGALKVVLQADNIKLKMGDNNHISIKSKKNVFNIIKHPDSINDLLGFHKKEYIGCTEYTSDNPYDLEYNNKAYLFLGNVDNDQPFAMIDMKKNANEICPLEKTFNNPISKLSNILIKFKENPDKLDDSLYKFNGEPHKLSFKIATM